MTTRLLMRGGLEPFGGEVLDFAAQRGLRVAQLSTRVDGLSVRNAQAAVPQPAPKKPAAPKVVAPKPAAPAPLSLAPEAKQ